ncbi:MAG: hypothetical protein CUN55_00240 [Phototrophicales bacterium]|nr:MAG: hypothetical protein CUN55_00240 [Phototrophicales bacterium]
MVPYDIEPNLADLTNYRAWAKSERDNLTLFATLTTSPDHVIAMARFFYPEFEIYRGGVFRKDDYNPFTVDHWLARTDGDISATEHMVNLRHLEDVFHDQSAEWSVETIVFLGHVIQRTWTIALADAFPDRSFKVVAECDEVNPHDVVVSFWQTHVR